MNPGPLPIPTSLTVVPVPTRPHIMGDNFSIDDESFGFHAPEITVVDPSALIAQLNAVVNNPNALKGADAAQRAEIQRLSRAASRTLEQPFDTMMRIMYSVRF